VSLHTVLRPAGGHTPKPLPEVGITPAPVPRSVVGHVTLSRSTGQERCGTDPVSFKKLDEIARQGAAAGIQFGAACHIAGVGTLTEVARALSLIGIE
jgi:hypothetical protein